MSNLSFSIAINLLTENFKKGAATVKSSFEQMKSQMLSVAAVFGVGGFAFTSFISKILSASKETAKANMILKNVSDGTADFASNLNYSNGIAKKYGLYVNDVTSSLAKFIPSANTANISASNQRKIFESVVRAGKAFGLSGEQTQEVLGGIDKSMRKGSLSTKDLRGALGTNLPIAMQAFAMATGKSIPQLNKLISSGKLLAKDVLPKFADALTKLTPNINTDTVETALNRLKNVINGIANNPNFLNAYKTGIKDVASLAEWAGNNIKNIVTQVGAVIAAYVIAKARTMVLNLKAQAGILEAQALKSNAVLIEATNNRVSAEIALENAKKDAIILNDGTILDGKKAIQAAELNLEKAKVTEENALEDTRVSAAKIADQQKLTNAKATSVSYIADVRKRIAAEIELNDANVQMSNAGNESEQLAATTRVSNAKRALKRAEVREAVAGETQMLAATEASAVKGASAWSTAFNTIKVGAAKAVTALSALWATYGPMLIITAITSVIFKLVEMAAESNRINGIWKEYKNGASAAVHTPEIVQLKEMQDLYNKANGNLKVQEQYRNKINSLLGTHLTGEKAINAAINERIKLLEATAKVDYYTQQKIQAQDTLTKIIGSYGGNGAYTKAVVSASNENYKYSKGKGSLLREHYRGPSGSAIFSGKTYADISNDKAEVAANMRILKNASTNISTNMAYASKNTKYTPSQTPVPGKPAKETEFEKAQDDYIKSMKEAAEKLDFGEESQTEYNNEVDKIKKDTLIKLSGLKQKGVKDTDLYKSLSSDVQNPKGTDELSKSYSKVSKAADENRDEIDKLTMEMRSEIDGTAEYTKHQNELSNLSGVQKALDGKVQYIGGLYQQALNLAKNDELTDNMKKYSDAVNKYEKDVKDSGLSLVQGTISQEAYKDKIDDLTQSVISEISIIPDLTDAQKSDMALLQKTLDHKADEVIQKAPDRDMSYGKGSDKKDSIFDYNKTKSEITQDSFDVNKQAIEYYKEQLKSAGSFSTTKINELRADLEKVEKVAPDMEKAMKVEKIKSDIEEMNKSLIGIGEGFSPQFEGTYAKIENITQAFEDLKGAVSNIQSVFSKSGNYLNKFITTLESAFTIFNSIVETIQKFKEIEKIVKSLMAAEEAEKAVRSGTKLANKDMSTVSEIGTGVKSASKVANGANTTEDITAQIAKKELLTKAEKAQAAASNITANAQIANATKTTAADAAATTTKLSTDSTKITSNTSVAASGAAASVAGIPLWGIGLAIGGVATMLALLGKLPKFAAGGVIGGGSTSGDNVLARVNSGEMILNGVQQGNLFKAINSGSLGGGKSINTTVTHVIKGSELKLLINNELRSKGKTLIGQ